MSKAEVTTKSLDVVTSIINFLNNPWVFTILTGVMSGLVVFFVSKIFFERKENKEYLQKLSSANNEILYAVRSSISEGIIPDIEVFSSIIDSVSRKYGIKGEKIFSIDSILSEIIKEIMDSSFIQNKDKNELCSKIIQYKKHVAKGNNDDVLKEIEMYISYRREQVRMKSIILAMASMVLISLVVLLWGTTDWHVFQDRDMYHVAIAMISSLLCIIITVKIAGQCRREKKNHYNLKNRETK